MASATKLTQERDLRDRLVEARAISDELFNVVRREALYDRPIAERHRIIFYVGHLEAFDWNLFCGQRDELRPFAPAFDRLFAFGIDPVDGQLPSDQPSDWPALSEVHGYNTRVRAELDRLIDTSGADLSCLLNTAIEHRLMHAETLAYMFHRLPFDRKIPQRQLEASPREFSPQMVDIPAGIATLGLRLDAKNRFGWDNEFEAHQVDVPGFAIDKYMVTNGEYLEFLRDRGYHRKELWANEGWEWIQSAHVECPAFWLKEGNRWLWRGMFEAHPLPLEWPVYASHAEATAYARWAGKALPTEAQWHRAAYGQPNGEEREFPWGSGEERAGKGNFDFERWDPAPVNSVSNNVSAFGVVGMLGNGWEWTSSEFAPFKGFQAFSFYPGYSANFFDGKHFVMKGGSARTSKALLRRSFRNWFQPHYQYVYSGIRCVSNRD